MGVPVWAQREIENGDAVKRAWRVLIAHNPSMRLCGGERSRDLWAALDALSGIDPQPTVAERLNELEEL